MPRAVFNPTASTPASDWSHDSRTAQSWTYGGAGGTSEGPGSGATPQQPTPSLGNLVYANIQPFPLSTVNPGELPISTANQSDAKGALSRDFPDIWYT